MKSLLALSQDLIFWQSEAQRQQQAGESERLLRVVALDVLGGPPTAWTATMTEAVKGLVLRLGADSWYAGVLNPDGAPSVVVSVSGPSVPIDGAADRLAPLMNELARRIAGGEPAVGVRGGVVAGLLWVPVRVDGLAGFSGCHSFSRDIPPSETARKLLHGLGEIALAAYRRVIGERVTSDADRTHTPKRERRRR